MKKFFLFLVISIIQSCSYYTENISPIIKPESFIQRFPENKRGIIFVKVNSKYPSTIWCKTSSIEINNNDCLEIKSSNFYQIFMIEPANYEIRGYQKISRYINQNSINPKFDASNKRVSQPLIMFEVKENKISFVGRIDYKNEIVMQEKTQDQDFEDIKKALIEQDQRSLKALFKNHLLEAQILSKKINRSETNLNILLEKNIVKYKSDLVEIQKRDLKEKKILKKKNNRKVRKIKSRYD